MKLKFSTAILIGLMMCLEIGTSKILSKGVENASFKHACYDGKDPFLWDDKRKLEEFAKGPCSPAVLLAGIGGSTLRVMIDCPKLLLSSPEVFLVCGWNGCGAKDKKPDPEYQIWVSAPVSPMSILSPDEKNKDCFAAFFSADYDYSASTPTYKPKPGITLKATGTTPGSKSYSASKCGSKGIEDLIPDIPNPELTENYKGIIERLEYMGYESGLTMQSLPYDFRLSSEMDPLTTYYAKVIEGLSKMNNKKVIIAAHSMSNLRTSYMLWKQSQSWKDTYIENYVAIAPPYMGTGLVINFITCGSDEYKFPLHMGFDWATYKKTILNFDAMFEMLPYPTYDSQKDTPWMQQIMKRIDYENGVGNDPVFDWIPKRDDVCYEAWPKAPKCKSGLWRLDNYGSDKDGNKITNQNFEQMMIKLSPNKNFDYFWKGRDSRYESLPNFGVNFTLLFSQVLLQDQGYDFKVDPPTWIDQHKTYCTEKTGGFTTIYVAGDTSVPSTSSVTPAMKFAMDFDNKVPGAKPVKIVEYCSSMMQKDSPYDSFNSKGEGQYTKNSYIGLPCDCTATKEKHCDHVSMLWLPKFFDFLSSTVKSGVRT